MSIDSVWEKRWNALCNELVRMDQDYGTLGSTLPRCQSLQILTQGLQNFTQSLWLRYIDWFTRGINSPEKYPPVYVLRTLLDQVAFDMTIVQYAAAQRMTPGPLRDRLAQADLLANDALQKAVNIGLFPGDKGFTALTYFTRVPRIRVIPYATVAIIAIPFTALEIDEDMLATAHEVGHYVYWHGNFTNPPWQTVKNEGKEKWLKDWLEEIFADVFSVWVAGPVAGLSIQDILSDNSPEEFCANDGHHPATIIRPKIYTTVIQNMTWRDYLNNRWETVKSTVPEDFRKPIPRPGKLPLDPDSAFAFTQELLSIVSGQLGIQNKHWHLPESLPVPLTTNEIQSDKVLYDSFSAFFRGLKEPVPDAPSQLNVIDLKLQTPAVRSTSNVRPMTTILADNPANDAEWEYVISAGGWVSKPPEQDPNPWPK